MHSKVNRLDELRGQLLGLLPEVRLMYEKAFGGIVGDRRHLDQMCEDSLNPQRALEQIANVADQTGVSLDKLRILEVGSGLGLSVAMARIEYGAEAYGVEPAKDEYSNSDSIARRVMMTLGLDPSCLTTGTGESLPYPEGYFDLVFSNNTLEHVQKPQAVLGECLRVLKPGGLMCIVVPNYGSWWEGHYGVPMIPHMPPWMFKIYARALGRDPRFVDTLQFVTYRKLNRWLKKYRKRLEVISLGEKLWEYRVKTLDFSAWSALSKLKSILKVVTLLRLGGLLLTLGRVLHWETPFVLVARKTEC